MRSGKYNILCLKPVRTFNTFRRKKQFQLPAPYPVTQLSFISSLVLNHTKRRSAPSHYLHINRDLICPDLLILPPNKKKSRNTGQWPFPGIEIIF